MKDRFNMEDEITTLYTFTHQLSLISDGILEHDLSKDDTVNAIEGLKVMLEIHTNKLMDTMCQCFNLHPHNDTGEGPNWATEYHE